MVVSDREPFKPLIRATSRLTRPAVRLNDAKSANHGRILSARASRIRLAFQHETLEHPATKSREATLVGALRKRPEPVSTQNRQPRWENFFVPVGHCPPAMCHRETIDDELMEPPVQLRGPPSAGSAGKTTNWIAPSTIRRSNSHRPRRRCQTQRTFQRGCRFCVDTARSLGAVLHQRRLAEDFCWVLKVHAERRAGSDAALKGIAAWSQLTHHSNRHGRRVSREVARIKGLKVLDLEDNHDLQKPS